MSDFPEFPKHEQPIVMIAQTKLDPSAESLLTALSVPPPGLKETL